MVGDTAVFRQPFQLQVPDVYCTSHFGAVFAVDLSLLSAECCHIASPRYPVGVGHIIQLLSHVALNASLLLFELVTSAFVKRNGLRQ